MKVQELRNRLEVARQELKAKKGQMVVFSDTGPIGIGLVEAMVSIIEELEQRVKNMEIKSV